MDFSTTHETENVPDEEPGSVCGQLSQHVRSECITATGERVPYNQPLGHTDDGM